MAAVFPGGGQFQRTGNSRKGKYRFTDFSRKLPSFASSWLPSTPTSQERAMSNPKDHLRIELTPEQKATIRSATGKDAEAVEFSVEELEARIAPSTLYNKGK